MRLLHELTIAIFLSSGGFSWPQDSGSTCSHSSGWHLKHNSGLISTGTKMTTILLFTNPDLWSTFTRGIMFQAVNVLAVRLQPRCWFRCGLNYLTEYKGYKNWENAGVNTHMISSFTQKFDGGKISKFSMYRRLTLRLSRVLWHRHVWRPPTMSEEQQGRHS